MAPGALAVTGRVIAAAPKAKAAIPCQAQHFPREDAISADQAVYEQRRLASARAYCRKLPCWSGVVRISLLPPRSSEVAITNFFAARLAPK